MHVSYVSTVPRLYPGIVFTSHSLHHQHLQLVLGDAIDRYELRLEDCNSLAHVHPLYPRSIRTQHAVRRDGASAAAAVRPVGLDGELALLAGAHVEQALVPALDNLTLAHGEAQWLAAVVRGVELAAVALEGAAVVHLDAVAGLGGAAALDLGDDFRLEVLLSLLATRMTVAGRWGYLVVDDVGDGGGGQGEDDGDLHDGCGLFGEVVRRFW
jgi:hypothetical protein